MTYAQVIMIRVIYKQIWQILFKYTKVQKVKLLCQVSIQHNIFQGQY